MLIGRYRARVGGAGWGGGKESMTCMTEHRRSYNNFRCLGGDR